MKSFLFASGAIIVLIALVIANGIYISSVTDKLEKMAEGISLGDTEDVLAIKEHLEKHEKFICLSVSHNDVDELMISVEVLLEKIKSNEPDGFYEYKAKLLNAIKEIKEKERLHIHNIA